MLHSRRVQQGLWFMVGACALTVAAFGFQARQQHGHEEPWPWDEQPAPVIPPRPQAVTFSASAVVAAGAQALQRLMQNAESLPLVLRFLHKVERVDDTHSRWTLRSTMGDTTTLDLRLARDVPLALLSWDVSGGGVAGTVTVEFLAPPGEGEGSQTLATQLTMSVDLRVDDASAVTPSLEQFFGDAPSQRLADDLRRLGVGIERGLLKVA